MEQLPERLAVVLQEKTKKKLMKSGNLMAYHQSLPVYASQPKKDYLMVDLNSYVLRPSFRSWTATASPFLCNCYSTHSSRISIFWSWRVSFGNQARLRRKSRLSNSCQSWERVRSSKTCRNTVDTHTPVWSRSFSPNSLTPLCHTKYTTAS